MPFDQARADAAINCERKSCGQPLGRCKCFVYESDDSDVIKEVVCRRCDTRDAFDAYVNTGVMSSDFSRFLLLYLRGDSKPIPELDPEFKDHELFWINRGKKAIDAIHIRVREFEKKVWFGSGLQNYIRKNGRFTFSWNDLHVLGTSSCGRFMLMATHTPSGDHVTLIADEEAEPTKEKPYGYMGLQGMYARPEMVEYLIETMVYHWSEFKLSSDKPVYVV